MIIIYTAVPVHQHIGNLNKAGCDHLLLSYFYLREKKPDYLRILDEEGNVFPETAKTGDEELKRLTQYQKQRKQKLVDALKAKKQGIVKHPDLRKPRTKITVRT